MLRILGILLGVVLLAVMGGAAVAWYDFDRWLAQPIDIGDEPRSFTIERGWSARRVARELETAGLIDKRHWFDVYVRLEDRGGDIRTGEYELSGVVTVPLLLDIFEKGQTVQYSHTLIEGSNWREAIARLSADDTLVHTLGHTAGTGDVGPLGKSLSDADGTAIMAAIGRPDRHPEGQFFADTYRFPRGTTDVEYLARAKATMDAVLEDEWAARADDLPLESPYEALILASIVEKETAVAAERPLIAGVFLSRMKKGMRLQTDPTVIYGIGPNFDGNIRRADLTTDTPYNTYTRAGLPPTPIAMVGREAIHAVLHPESTTKLFFVARGDGTHQFSETVKEHNAAVRKFQLRR